jgi:hypothetical protein
MSSTSIYTNKNQLLSKIINFDPNIHPLPRAVRPFSEKDFGLEKSIILNIEYFHGRDRYDLTDIKNCSEYPNKIKIICGDHSFYASTKEFCRASIRKCPICKKVASGKTHTELTEYISSVPHHEFSRIEYFSDKVSFHDSDNNTVTVVCTKHNFSYNQILRNLKARNGCIECLKEKRKNNNKNTTEKFIEKAKKIHGDDFSYELANYIGRHKKLKIKHIDCGKYFEMTAGNHLNGQKCPHCRPEKISTTAKNTHHLNVNNKNDNCIVYKVTLAYGEDTFIKFGITRKTIKKRFASATGFKVITQEILLEDSYEKCVKYEEQINALLKNYKYKLTRYRGLLDGWTECYPLSCGGIILP